MSESDREAPRVFAGRYALIDEVGHGGEGRVFRARDERLSRDVAVKLLPQGEHDEHDVRRFKREARAAGSLNHPNIVVVHDAGDQDGEPYLVTELLDGETLRKALTRGPLDPAWAADVAFQIARGLAAAHEHGIVHRDLKPENLFVTRGGVLKILDFGIAQLPRDCTGVESLRTATGAPMGTVLYMSPEQVRGQKVDARSDLFGLGSVLHELLSGSAPFDRPTVLDTGHAIIAEAPPALPRQVPAAFAAAVNRCLKKDPADRFGSAREFADALQAASHSWHTRLRRRVAVVVGAMMFSATMGALLTREFPYLRGRFSAGKSAGEHPLVAVADVANRTGEAELAALSGLLTVSLEQSRRISVITRSRLSDLARQVADVEPERIDEVLGRRIAQKARAKALLIIAVHRLGARYVVELRAVDPERDRYLFTVREEALGKDALLAVIDRLSERTRRELGDDRAEIETSRIEVGQALTMNLEAYQHYVRGIEVNIQYGELAASVQEWRRAVELDPNLAIAHRMLAYVATWYGGPTEEAEHAKAALSSIDRMPEKDRAIILGMDAVDNGDRPKAITSAEQLIARYPNDKVSQFFAAHILQGAGELRRAEDVYRRVLELDPGCAALWDLTMLLENSGRIGEILPLARRGVAARPTAINTAILSWATALSGDSAQSVVLAREAIRLNAGVSMYVTHLTYQVLAFNGEFEEAEQEVRRVSLEGLNEHEREFGTSNLIGLQAFRGRRREALKYWNAGPARYGRYPVAPAMLLAVGHSRHRATEALQLLRTLDSGPWLAAELALHGDFVAAAKAATKLADGSPPHAVYRAIALGDEKGREASIAALRTLASELIERPAKFPETEVRYLLGDLLLAAGRPTEAIEAMRPLRGVLTLGGNMYELAENWPRAILVRAHAYEQLGQIDDAVRELDGLLATWRQADSDLPLLADARAMRARLGRAIAIDVPMASP